MIPAGGSDIGIAIDGGLFGPDVTLIRTRFDGTTRRERLAAYLAVDMAQSDRDNGVVWRSARVVFGNVLDVWGY